MKRIALPLAALLLMAQSAAPPPPKLTLTPSSGVVGQTFDVTTNVSWPPNGTMSFEPAGNITITNPRLTNKLLQFTIQISSKATPGLYGFTYTPMATAAAPKTVRVANVFTV